MPIIPLNFLFCLFFAYEEPILSPKNIYVMGDSLAQGLSTPIKKYAKDNNIKFHSRTIVGSTSIQWSKFESLNQDLNNYKPDLIVVSLGTNDMRGDRSPQSSIEKISNKLINTGAKVVWLIPPSMPFPDRGIRDFIYQLPKRVNKLKCDDSILERSKDKIHFTQKGYSEWANCIIENNK